MKKIILVFLLFSVNAFCQEKEITPTTDEEIPVTVIDQVPLFPICKEVEKTEQLNCFQKMIDQHVISNFKIPKKTRKEKIKARIIVNFVIDKEGFVTNIEATGGNATLRKEAVRVFKKIPQLTPGFQREKPVTCKFTYPITINTK